MPVASINKCSIHKHLLEMLKIFGVVIFHEGVVVVEGDAGVLRISADVDDLAALLKDVR